VQFAPARHPLDQPNRNGPATLNAAVQWKSRTRNPQTLARVDLAPLPRLRHWREQRELTQEKLADLIGMRRNVIWRIEAGYATRARTARSLARALLIEIEDLVV
jgi:DNA-binding XRE family transcriptional regulator